MRLAGGQLKLKIASVEFVGIKEIESLASNDKKSNYSSIVLPLQIQERQLVSSPEIALSLYIGIYKVCQAKAL